MLAEVTCFCSQVLPPSVERVTTRGAAPEPRNWAKQTYTFPKKRLEAASSAQICSLSANVAELCRCDAITGRILLVDRQGE